MRHSLPTVRRIGLAVLTSAIALMLSGSDGLFAQTCTTQVDDGTFEDGFPVPFGFSNATMVQRLVPNSYPATLNTVCVCWKHGGAGGSMPFNLVAFADGVIPGASLAVVPANSGTVLHGSPTFSNIACGELDITLESGGIYVGPNWNESENNQFFVCGDTSLATPVASSFYSVNSGGSWTESASFWHTLRALGIRAEFTAPEDSVCVAGPTTACLLDRRFKVEVTWTDFQAVTRTANVAAVGTSDSALFYFGANVDNWEFLIKAIDGCGLNNKQWIFFAAATNVGYTVTVTDTKFGGEPRIYRNSVGDLAQAVADIEAFNCP